MIHHLHEDFHSVQRGGACAGHGARHGARRQLPPPQTGGLLLLRELIRYGEAVTNVQHLGTKRAELKRFKYHPCYTYELV